MTRAFGQCGYSGWGYGIDIGYFNECAWNAVARSPGCRSIVGACLPLALLTKWA